MIKVKERSGNFYFYKNDKIITTPNGSKLKVKNKNQVERILDDFKKQKYSSNPNSILNLTLFSCNLDDTEKGMIVTKVIEILKCDSAIYRCFDDRNLVDFMNKNLNFYVNKFKRKFNVRIELLHSILSTLDYDSDDFTKFLKKIDKFRLTVLYKSGILTKSTILSYFFMNRDIDYKILYKLSNLEYIYQQKMWGKLDEHKIIEKNSKNALKNLSFFLNNLD